MVEIVVTLRGKDGGAGEELRLPFPGTNDPSSVKLKKEVDGSCIAWVPGGKGIVHEIPAERITFRITNEKNSQGNDRAVVTDPKRLAVMKLNKPEMAIIHESLGLLLGRELTKDKRDLGKKLVEVFGDKLVKMKDPEEAEA